MKPEPRERKNTKPFQPATQQNELMSEIKKKKRQTMKEKMSKRKQREKAEQVQESKELNKSESMGPSGKKESKTQ